MHSLLLRRAALLSATALFGTLTACSSGDGGAQSSQGSAATFAGPTPFGTYTAASSNADVQKISFIDGTRYSAWVANCPYGTGDGPSAAGCAMDGTYTIDDSGTKLTLHDDASDTDATYDFQMSGVGSSTSAPSSHALDELVGDTSDAGDDDGGSDSDSGSSSVSLVSGDAGPLVCPAVPLLSPTAVSVSGTPMTRTTTCASRNYSIVYIGDSHSDFAMNGVGKFGYLGYHFNTLMQAEQARVALFAASGSSPNWWLDGQSVQTAKWGYTQTVTSPPETICSNPYYCTPKLSKILTGNPDLFIVEQGTNLIGVGSNTVTTEINALLQAISGKAGGCLWISAPRADPSKSPNDTQTRQDALWQIMQQTVGQSSCYLYDSRYLPEVDGNGKLILDGNGNPIQDVPQLYNGNDGEHFSMAPAGKWAEGVALIVDYLRGKSQATSSADAGQ